MTPEERAAATWAELVYATGHTPGVAALGPADRTIIERFMLDAIRAAVEEERAACAALADGYFGEGHARGAAIRGRGKP